jgi:hypothetical protein
MAMETRDLTFYGGEPGPDGLPKTFHRDLVVASPAPGLGRNASIASVVALTSAPEPTLPHFVVSDCPESASGWGKYANPGRFHLNT